MKNVALLLIFLFFHISLCAQKNERRKALIIANSEYEIFPHKNAINNATSLKLELEKLGFNVIMHINVAYKDMRRVIREFGDSLSKVNDVGLFYFAGYGIQSKGYNYLIPINAKVERESDIAYETVDINLIFSVISYEANFLNIVMLDVPPLNPYWKYMNRGSQNGFAMVSAPENTIIAFSSTPTNVPLDRRFNEQIYIEELIKAIRTPNIGIFDIFKKVRQSIYNKSDGLQIPWETSNFDGKFYLKKEKN